jgi:hypothetical protein
MKTSVRLSVVVVLVLCSIAGLSQIHASAPVSADEAQKWHADLQFFSVEMPKRHKNLYHKVAREKFESEVNSLSEQVPTLTRNQILVGLARIVASIGDGHTSLLPRFDPALGLHRYPVTFYFFQDGLFVKKAAPEYKQIVGGKLVRFGKFDINEAYRRMSEIANGDNAIMVKDVATEWLSFPEFVEGLGIVDSMNDTPLTVEKDGRQLTVHLHPIAADGAQYADWVDFSDGAPNPLPLYRKDPDDFFWFEYLKDSQTVYMKYNVVGDKPGEPLEDFFHRVFAFIDTNPVDRLVIDIRDNQGGNGYLNWPLIYAIIRSDKINQRGKLFTIIGRRTFSAAGMCAIYLERHTNTLFVGEPTGASPNGYGDHIPLTLPNSRIKVFVSTLYWQEADPRDRRPWIAPQIAAPLTSEEYRNNVDPAMQAILSFGNRPPLTDVVRGAVLEKNMDVARQAIRQYKADPMNAYANFEGDMNRLGYVLMGGHQIEAAVMVFRLNAEAYPDSANVYDSLAEAYANRGDRELAIQNYKKSLQLNPENPGAQEALTHLGAP